MKAQNPYRWNQVDTSLFYGRQSFVEDLVLDALDGQSFAVMGGKRMGKTTLLRKVEEEVVSRFSSLLDGGLVVIPVYLDTLSIEELHSSDVISRKILETVIQFIDQQGLKAGYASHAASSKYSILNPFAREIFYLIETISNYRVQIVVLFDEISPIVYAEWGSTYLGNWRALLHNTPPLSNHVSAVFTGACEIVKLAVDVSSPLANILSWRFLHSLSCEDTELLVHEPTKYCLPNDFHTRVFEATGGHPFLTQYLMFYVVASRLSDPYRALDDACQHFLNYEHRQFQNAHA